MTGSPAAAVAVAFVVVVAATAAAWAVAVVPLLAVMACRRAMRFVSRMERSEMRRLADQSRPSPSACKPPNPLLSTTRSCMRLW